MVAGVLLLGFEQTRRKGDLAEVEVMAGVEVKAEGQSESICTSCHACGRSGLCLVCFSVHRLKTFARLLAEYKLQVKPQCKSFASLPA